MSFVHTDPVHRLRWLTSPWWREHYPFAHLYPIAQLPQRQQMEVIQHKCLHGGKPSWPAAAAEIDAIAPGFNSAPCPGCAVSPDSRFRNHSSSLHLASSSVPKLSWPHEAAVGNCDLPSPELWVEGPNTMADGLRWWDRTCADLSWRRDPRSCSR